MELQENPGMLQQMAAQMGQRDSVNQYRSQKSYESGGMSFTNQEMVPDRESFMSEKRNSVFLD